MTLKTTPAVSASPRPPDVLVTTSCEPATFTTAAFEFAPAHPMLRPSDRVRESDGRPPCMLPAPPPVPPVMPPESPSSDHPRNQRLDAGGVSRGRDGRQDVPVHRALHLRALDVDDRRLAETVIVSARAPTFSSALTVAMNVPLSSIPSRLNALKPVSENVTE